MHSIELNLSGTRLPNKLSATVCMKKKFFADEIELLYVYEYA